MRLRNSSFRRFWVYLTLAFLLHGAAGWVSDHSLLPNLTKQCEAAPREYPPGAYPGKPTPTPIPGFPSGVYGAGPPIERRPVPSTERWPVIVIGTVEKELGSVQGPRPGTEDWNEPMINDWAEVEVNVEQVLKGDIPSRIVVRRMLLPQGGGAGFFHHLRVGERVLFFLEGTGDGSDAYRISPWDEITKTTLADSPAVIDSSKTSALDTIHAELAHGLEADDAYVVHEIMNALWRPEFFTEKAIPALKGLAKSPDPWLSLHALSLLSLRAGDQEAFEAVVRRVEAGDYSLQMGVLEADGTVTADTERDGYAHSLPGLWIEGAIAGAAYPSALPTLTRMAESTELKSWVRKEAMSKLSQLSDEPNLKLWRLFLEDSDRSLQYWTINRMRGKFDNHNLVQLTPDLYERLEEEVFDKDPDKYVDLWLGFLNILEAEQASKGK